MSGALSIQKASAGSGKTYRLAYTYIKLALGENGRLFYPKAHNRHRDILAVTFTNKATGEMKQRIIKELDLLGDVSGHSDYRKDLMREYAVDAMTLAAAARQTLTEILFDYGNFSVSTIDAFFQRVLRSFAYEADLSGNYELVLDDLMIRDMSVALTLEVAAGITRDRSVDRRELARYVREYMRHLQSNGESFMLLNPDDYSRKQLRKFVKDLTNERYQAHRESIMKIAGSLDAMRTLANNVREKLEQTYGELQESIAEVPTDGVALSSYARNALQGIASLDKIGERLKYIKDPDNNKTFISGTTDSGRMAYYRWAESVMDVVVRYNTLAAIDKNMYNLGLFGAVLHYGELLKADNNMILLSDTNTLLGEIIGDAPEPFIYERIGQRYRHFLIDEFQDTSRLQWENFRPLLTQSLAAEQDNLIIGDVKQSIYRFRNSDSKLLASEIEQDPDISRYVEVTSGDTNYRSAREVVEFNNAVFDSLGRAYGFGDIYATVAQKVHKGDLEGYVKVRYADNDDNARLVALTEDIERQLADGYAPRDIVVLVRTRKQGVKVVEHLLNNLPPEVKVMSDEALLLKSSKAIRYIVDRLGEMDAPEWVRQSNGRRKTATDMQWFEQRLDDLHQEGLDPDMALAQAIKEINSQDERPLPQGIDASASLYDIVERLLTTLPDEQMLTDDAQYISAFQDRVVEYCSYGSPTLHGFLEYWHGVEDKAAVGVFSGDNSLRVMTIHKSKGLEFPCVHIPLGLDSIGGEEDLRWYDCRDIKPMLGFAEEFPDFLPIKSNKSLNDSYFTAEYKALLQESMLDGLNILYVALTRAVRELSVIIATPARNGKGEGVAPEFAAVIKSSFGEDIMSGENAVFEYGCPTSKRNVANVDDAVGRSLVVDGYLLSHRDDPWAYTRIDPEEIGEDVKMY